MKKLFVFLIILFAAFSTKAQFGQAAAFAVNTLTNVDTVNNVITATAGYNALGIQVIANKTSGTFAAKAFVYQSMDGINYQVTDSVTAFTATPIWAGGPTPTYGYSATFNKQSVPGVHYLVSVISSGTVVETYKVLYTLRKSIWQ